MIPSNPWLIPTHTWLWYSSFCLVQKPSQELAKPIPRWKTPPADTEYVSTLSPFPSSPSLTPHSPSCPPLAFPPLLCALPPLMPLPLFCLPSLTSSLPLFLLSCPPSYPLTLPPLLPPSYPPSLPLALPPSLLLSLPPPYSPSLLPSLPPSLPPSPPHTHTLALQTGRPGGAGQARESAPVPATPAQQRSRPSHLLLVGQDQSGERV